jgi:sulfonate transport system ATP-binding protein
MSLLARRNDDADRAGAPGRDARSDTGSPPGVSVRAQGLVKSFGASRVLHGLDLYAPAGEFLVIVGRSGCGKTTLLRLLAGLESADAGRIQIGNRPAAEAKGAVRTMFQEARLLPWATVLANVEVGLAAERDAPDVRERALGALAAVGLADRADAWPAALSGGQRQRVALARALVSRPRFLALDEPLGALDALTRIEMQQLLESAWRREQFTAILVTHDVAEAITLGDRVLLIEDGAIARDVAIDLPRPRHRGSARFAALEESILQLVLQKKN